MRQGSGELCALNRFFLEQFDTNICYFLTAWCQLVCFPNPGSFTGHGHDQKPRMVLEKRSWSDMFHRAPLPPALLPPATAELKLHSWMLLLCPGVRVGAVDSKEWRGKAMQRHLTHCRQTRCWVIVHYNRSYSKAGRAVLVLGNVFSSGKKKCWKVSFCLNLT